jgi:hypothetical protein
MTMSKAKAMSVASDIINAAKARFYDGADPTVLGCKITGGIRIEEGATPNGNLTPTGDVEYGLMLSEGVLAINDDDAIAFIIGHELGHGFTEQINNKIKLTLNGAGTEVIADLTSAYLLTELQMKPRSWAKVLETVNNWKASGMFDENQNGQHPPGALRAQHVRSLFGLMNAAAPLNRSFEAAVRQLLSSV